MANRILARGAARNAYTVRMARTVTDIQAAQMLRFLVFNVELNEGLEASYHTCRDEDPFDEVCDHLLVESDGKVVGTYRLQTGHNASQKRGYYSEQEFDFTPFESMRAEIIELGRACVMSEHRNLVVVGLLWRGIASYARQHGSRYLIGCSSFNSQVREVLAASFREGIRHGATGGARDLRLYLNPWDFTLERIVVPVTLWHGEYDTIVPAAMGRELAGSISHCEAIFLPEEGHYSLPINHIRLILARLLEIGR